MSEKAKDEMQELRNVQRHEIATLVEKHQGELQIVKSENTESYQGYCDDIKELYESEKRMMRDKICKLIREVEELRADKEDNLDEFEQNLEEEKELITEQID